MKRVIVDYSKLTQDILNLLVEKFPEGYEETDIIRFKNAQNELVEAVEVRTHDTIYLVKVSKKLASRMEKFDEEFDEAVEPIAPSKDLELDDDLSDDEEEVDLLKDKGSSFDDEDEDDEDDFGSDTYKDDEDEDEED
ncbi:MAG: DNA primase [Flavobacterium sp. BFFFF2]|nr:MAG: DNA primase [Flavobacterium sp. BFFFF2]